jgi:hypothetical protein
MLTVGMLGADVIILTAENNVLGVLVEKAVLAWRRWGSAAAAGAAYCAVK